MIEPLNDIGYLVLCFVCLSLQIITNPNLIRGTPHPEKVTECINEKVQKMGCEAWHRVINIGATIHQGPKIPPRDMESCKKNIEELCFSIHHT